MAKINRVNLIRSLWAKVCRADGVPEDAKFVCFSGGNPYAQAHSRLMAITLPGGPNGQFAKAQRARRLP